MDPESRTDRDHPYSATRRIAKNTLYLVAADVANKVLMLAYFVVAARHLGAEKFGLLSFALAYVNMFSVVTDLGLGVVTAREIARDHGVAERLVGNALAMKLAMSGVAIVAVMISVRLLGYPSSAVALADISSLFILFNGVALYYAYVFQGFERMAFSAVARMLQTSVLIAGAYVLARAGTGTVSFAWLNVLAAGLAAVVSWVIVSTKLVPAGFGVDFPQSLRMIRRSLPVGLAAVFSMLYYWNASVILTKTHGETAVGIYSAPFRLVLGLCFVAYGFAGAVYPVMSRLHVNEPTLLREMVTRAFRYMLMAALPLGICGMVLARPAIGLLYGAGYLNSAGVFAILVWWGLFIYLNSLLSNYFYAIDLARVVTIQTGGALVVNLALNAILIPHWGPGGAAVSITVAEGISLGFLLWRQTRTNARFYPQQIFRLLPRALLAALGASAAGFVTSRWHAAAGGLVVVVVYILLLLLLRGLESRDLQLMRMILQRGDG